MRGVKRGEEEGGRRWVGRRVSELMTVLSAGAERAEMERASVFSTTCLSLPELKGTEKRGQRAEIGWSAEVMDD